MSLHDAPFEQMAEPEGITLVYRCGHQMLLQYGDEISYPGECALCLEAYRRWHGISVEEARACITDMILEWQAQAAPVPAEALSRQILFVLNYLAF